VSHAEISSEWTLGRQPFLQPDWGEAAEIAFQTIFPHLVVLLLLQDIEHLRELARKSWN
jgi:hypothetical protein